MRSDIRLALPSKGLLAEETMQFLADCGLKVYRPNPRQYAAAIPALPSLTIIFQRPGDIVTSVQQGSVDFGITGLDMLAEKRNGNNDILTLHDALGFGPCRLQLAVPEAWAVTDLESLRQIAREKPEGHLRVATKFPKLTSRFLDEQGITPYQLINAEGTLEIAPVIGTADLIADLVSSGTTLRDNHLRPLPDGLILHSQACLIAHRGRLQKGETVLAAARDLLEYIEAHLRAQECHLVFANIRGASPQSIAQKMNTQPHLSGLQGPTISPVFPPGQQGESGWFAINIVIRKNQLTQTIAELRAIGGSGVIVTPVTYIFEEEPARYRQMVAALAGSRGQGILLQNSS